MESGKTAKIAADSDQPGRKRGRPSVPGGKRAVNLRLDNDVVDFYRAKGPGWQTRVNEALRKAMERSNSE